jgi:2-polyprenyl-3-methyl-5-hydroxy-6-metoxy-1,4-benzoquinol methylase
VERLEQRYREHHRDARAPDFIWARPERTALFKRHVGGPGKRVLDLGCRYGALTAFYADGNEVVGVDIDREALDQAGERLGIETRWADLDEPLPFDDESFDVVVIGEVLEHVREPQRLVDESRRVLRPRGTLVGSTPNSFRLKNRLRFVAGRHPEPDPTHLHMFSPSDVRQLLSRFDGVSVQFVAGRLARVHSRLFANVAFFTATKRR